MDPHISCGAKLQNTTDIITRVDLAIHDYMLYLHSTDKSKMILFAKLFSSLATQNTRVISRPLDVGDSV